MIVSTNGKSNQRVSAAWLGGMPAWSIWLGGQKLYPDGENNALLLPFEQVAESDALWNYWQHALYAYKYENWSVLALSATVNGKTYIHGKNECVIDISKGLVVLGKYSVITMSEALAGDVRMSIKVSLAERVTDELNGENTLISSSTGERTVALGLPIIPDISFETWRNKGQKKKIAAVDFEAKGLPSEQKFVWGSGSLGGHWRGSYHCSFDSKSGGRIGNQKNQKLSVNNKWVPGDTSWQVWARMRDKGYNFRCKATYPAFTKVFNVRYIRIN